MVGKMILSSRCKRQGPNNLRQRNQAFLNRLKIRSSLKMDLGMIPIFRIFLRVNLLDRDRALIKSAKKYPIKKA